MNCVVYARYSPRPEKPGKPAPVKPMEADSVEKQLERCSKWCESRGYTIVASESDKALSGATTDRPGLTRALAAVKKHRALLVVYTLDRLSRDAADTGTILKDLVRRRLAVASVTENLDLSTPAGRFLANIMAAMAQFQRETTSERTSRTMREYQQSGFRMGSRPPTGMKNNCLPGRMEPNPDELAGLDRAREIRTQNPDLGFRRVAALLTQEGFRYRGGQWTHITLYRHLKGKA